MPFKAGPLSHKKRIEVIKMLQKLEMERIYLENKIYDLRDIIRKETIKTMDKNILNEIEKGMSRYEN